MAELWKPFDQMSYGKEEAGDPHQEHHQHLTATSGDMNFGVGLGFPVTYNLQYKSLSFTE
jgi:hypothetical protein